MRTIKFRGKDSNGNWHYGDLEHSPIGKFCRIHEYRNNGFYKWHADVDPDTVGQFTGLTDADGNEIYEGDLLLSHENGEVFEVVYDAPRFCFKDNDFGFRFLNRPENFAVVGNIHDSKKGGES
jgi:hypothetical protein